MKSKKKRLDYIIYLSLFAAIICVGISAIDYVHSMSADQTIKSDVKEAIQEIKNPEPPQQTNNNENNETEEPYFLVKEDKEDIIKKHIDEVLDNYTKDQLVSWKQIKTWETYQVYDVKYVKEVTDNYYTYQFKLKISGANPELPVEKDNELSSEGNTVIILNANLTRNQASLFNCKTLEIPQEIIK